MINTYAIVQASGKQYWVEENRFYDFNRLPLNPGETFKLNKVLLVKGYDGLKIGQPFLESSYHVEATVIRHLSGSNKIKVYKMRPKKKTRKTFGSRSKLTRILINSIVANTKDQATAYI